MTNDINKFKYVSNIEYELSDFKLEYKSFFSIVKANNGDTICVAYKGKDVKGSHMYEFFNPKIAFWDRAFIHFKDRDDENAVKWISNYFYINNILVDIIGEFPNNSTLDKN